MTIWTELSTAWDHLRSTPMSQLFDNDPARAARFSAKTGDMMFDFSKTHITDEVLSLLVELARKSNVEEKRTAMFAGEKINETEGRAVLHTALRAPSGPIMVDGVDVLPAVQETRARMAQFADDLRAGRYQGQGGKITDVINIGIGGSDLGPAMATLALAPYHDGPRVHYVSNVDGAHINDTLQGLDPSFVPKCGSISVKSNTQ